MNFFRLMSLFLLCSMFSSQIFAALLNLNPVNLRFYPGHLIEALEITNEDVNSISLQLDVKKWQQDKNGIDSYFKTEDLFITPHIVTIPPNQTQLIRISLLNVNEADRQKERCYRLIIREIIPIEAANILTSKNLKISLQMLLPIFVNTRDVQPIYSWSFYGNKNAIELVNQGDNHLLVTGLLFINKDNVLVYEKEGLFAYILPGASKQFTINLPDTVINDAALSLLVK